MASPDSHLLAKKCARKTDKDGPKTAHGSTDLFLSRHFGQTYFFPTFVLSERATLFAVNIVLSNSPPRARVPKKEKRSTSPPVPALLGLHDRNSSRDTSLDSPGPKANTTAPRISPEEIPEGATMPTLVAKDLTQAEFEEQVGLPSGYVTSRSGGTELGEEGLSVKIECAPLPLPADLGVL